MTNRQSTIWLAIARVSNDWIMIKVAEKTAGWMKGYLLERIMDNSGLQLSNYRQQCRGVDWQSKINVTKNCMFHLKLYFVNNHLNSMPPWNCFSGLKQQITKSLRDTLLTEKTRICFERRFLAIFFRQSQMPQNNEKWVSSVNRLYPTFICSAKLAIFNQCRTETYSALSMPLGIFHNLW